MVRVFAAALLGAACSPAPERAVPPAAPAPDAGVTLGVTVPNEAASAPAPADPGVPAWDFRDATAESGIDFSVETASPELLAGGVGLLDADGDGDLDLFLANDTAPSAFFRNEGGATFVEATGEAGLSGITAARGVAIGDYDDDGDPDLYVGRLARDLLLRNDGGVFTDVTDASGAINDAMSYGAAWCDVDVDGDLDLYVGNYLITLDGRDAPFFRGDPNRLFRNDGGAFVDVAPESGVDSTGATLAVACADYDDDGDPDLWEVNDYGMFNLPDRLWRNDGGTFVDVAWEVGVADRIFGMSAAAADFDNDGDLDLAASNFATNVLHRNDGGFFTDVARDVGAGVMGFSDPAQGFPGYPDFDDLDPWIGGLQEFVDRYCDVTSTDLLLTHWSAIFFDYDQDGWQDQFVASGWVGIAPTLPEGRAQPGRLLRNAGGTFVDRSIASRTDTRGEARAAAAGDLDGDGDLDLVVAGGSVLDPAGNATHLFLNEAAHGHWLAVRAVGTASARDSVGARVIVRAGGVEQMREIAAGSGFASASPPIAHFGLGDAATADEVVVRWPSGASVTMEDVEADRTLEIVEP